MKKLLPLIALAVGSMQLLAQPTITQQLTNQVVALGGTMTLSVTASDPLAAYQWFKDGRLLLDATNNALTVTNAGGINTGAYLVVVTNGSGIVISQPALVAVGNPALLAWGNDQYGQLGDGQSGLAYYLTIPELNLGNVVISAAGGTHSLFVKPDGTLWAIGNNQNGQLGDGTTTTRTSPVLVIGGTNVVAVAAGPVRSFFLRSDGTLWVMGSGFSPTPTSLTSNVVAVATGFLQTLLVKSDGTLCTADSSTPIIGGSNVVAVAAGGQHSLFLKTDGTLWAMGNNASGQLGDGTTTTRNNPVPVIGGTNVVAVAAGFIHSLFLRSDGTLWAMGNNQKGQLGNGTTTSASTPISMASNVVAVAAGSYHSLFLRNDGTLWAMGNNQNGQLGNGTTANQTAPVPVTSGTAAFADVYSGCSATHSLAIGQLQASAITQAPMPVTATNAMLNGMAFLNGLPNMAWFEWGLRGSYTQTTAPVDVGSGYGVVRVCTLISGLDSSNIYQCRLVSSNYAGVSVGAVQWFRVDNAPEVAAWGANQDGQSQVPQNFTNVTAVAASGWGSLALLADGTVREWGNNAAAKPASATNVVALCAGHWDLNLALRGDGTVSYWGASATVPTGLQNVVEVAAGDWHGLVLEADGQLIAWPIYGGFYQNYGQATVPFGLTNVVAIGCGANHNLVLLADRTVVAWGYNDDGETVVPPDATNVVAIAPGSFHNLVLRADGTVVAWGLDEVGQSDVPAGLSNVVAIAAGGFHSMALKSDGTVVAWGGLEGGPEIVPFCLSNVVAIAAGGFHSLALGGNVPPVAISQTNSGFVNQDLVITPTLSDANNDALTCRVTFLPAQGALFQYAGSARGQQITAPNTTITDASLRVIFAPAPNNVGNPYTTFGLVANDGQADSVPATMTINLFKAPQNFTAQYLGTGLQLQLAGSPNYPYILQVATNLTPPVNWQSILTNPADVNGNWSFTVTNLSAIPAGFYRAVGQ